MRCKDNEIAQLRIHEITFVKREIEINIEIMHNLIYRMKKKV